MKRWLLSIGLIILSLLVLEIGYHEFFVKRGAVNSFYDFVENDFDALRLSSQPRLSVTLESMGAVDGECVGCLDPSIFNRVARLFAGDRSLPDKPKYEIFRSCPHMGGPCDHSTRSQLYWRSIPAEQGVAIAERRWLENCLDDNESIYRVRRCRTLQFRGSEIELVSWVLYLEPAFLDFFARELGEGNMSTVTSVGMSRITGRCDNLSIIDLPDNFSIELWCKR